MKELTTALAFFICISSGVYANSMKHSVADVMERHHGLSGPVFFVKANHLMANEKMSQSLGIQASVQSANPRRDDSIASAEDTRSYTSSKRGPSFSEVSEKHRDTYSHRRPDALQTTDRRFTAFRLEDKASSI
jgi:hypothetical protein